MHFLFFATLTSIRGSVKILIDSGFFMVFRCFHCQIGDFKTGMYSVLHLRQSAAFTVGDFDLDTMRLPTQDLPLLDF